MLIFSARTLILSIPVLVKWAPLLIALIAAAYNTNRIEEVPKNEYKLRGFLLDLSKSVF